MNGEDISGRLLDEMNDDCVFVINLLRYFIPFLNDICLTKLSWFQFETVIYYFKEVHIMCHLGLIVCAKLKDIRDILQQVY